MRKHFKSFATKSSQNLIPRTKTEENIDINFTKKIIKSLIYIYYFENDRDEIINNQEYELYFINYDWMQKFKDIAPFEEAVKTLSKLTINKKPIKYNNLKDTNEDIIKYFIDNKILLIKDKEKYKVLTNVINFIPRQIENNKIDSSPLFYIISSEIKNILEDIIFDGKYLPIEPIHLSIKDKNILVIEEKIIKVCNLDKTNKLTIKYIFMYKTKEIFNSEFTKLNN